MILNLFELFKVESNWNQTGPNGKWTGIPLDLFETKRNQTGNELEWTEKEMSKTNNNRSGPQTGCILV